VRPMALTAVIAVSIGPSAAQIGPTVLDVQQRRVLRQFRIGSDALGNDVC
jgi:hypothetical protein